MIIPRRLSLDTIEDLLLNIERDDAGFMRVPSSISFGGAFGVDTALLQLLTTWSRAQPESCLHLYSSSEASEAYLKDFVKQPYALAALIMAKTIHDEGHSKIPRINALKPAFDVVDAMYKGKLDETAGETRGHRPTTISLMSIGNAEREFLRPLYKSDNLGDVRSADEFVDLLKNSLAELAGKSALKKMNKSLPALGTLLFELFSNTDQHATKDLEGNFYNKSVRGIIIKRHMIISKNVARFCGNNPYFNRYFSKINANNQTPMLRAIEISVFDSGPGLAQRWVAKEPTAEPIQISLEDELAATTSCFEKYLSTKPTKSSGMGLFQVLQALNYVGGFLRIRTGRTCLFQAFNGGKLTETNFQPKSWYGDRPLANVAGCLFTICLPIISHE